MFVHGGSRISFNDFTHSLYEWLAGSEGPVKQAIVMALIVIGSVSMFYFPLNRVKKFLKTLRKRWFPTDQEIVENAFWALAPEVRIGSAAGEHVAIEILNMLRRHKKVVVMLNGKKVKIVKTKNGIRVKKYRDK